MKITFYGKGGPIDGKLIALESRVNGCNDLLFDVKVDGKDTGRIACGDTLEDPPADTYDEAILAAIEAQAAPRIARALVAFTSEILGARESAGNGTARVILDEEFPQ